MQSVEMSSPRIELTIQHLPNVDFYMEEAKRQKQDLQELTELACLHLPSASQDSGGVVAEGNRRVSGSEEDFVDEEEEDAISTDAIFELARLSLDDVDGDDHVNDEGV
ncbi:hypothetical protein V1525DRAFT_409118, partial [Lipomyces kononenkoae]